MIYTGDSAKSIAQQVGALPEMVMITILGNPADTAQYANREGYNVHAPDLTPEQVRTWIHEAVERGDDFRLVSHDFTGAFGQEVRWLFQEEQRLRMEGRVLERRALAIGEAVRDARKRAVGLD